MPGLSFSSTTDQTSELLGISCAKLEEPFPFSSKHEYSVWNKLARLIEDLPE